MSPAPFLTSGLWLLASENQLSTDCTTIISLIILQRILQAWCLTAFSPLHFGWTTTTTKKTLKCCLNVMWNFKTKYHDSSQDKHKSFHSNGPVICLNQPNLHEFQIDSKLSSLPAIRDTQKRLAAKVCQRAQNLAPSYGHGKTTAVSFQ